VGSRAPGDTSSADYCAALEKALLETMEIFGADSAQAMVIALKSKYGIRFGSAPCSSIEEIEKALVEITGTGADIIISRMRSFLR
jgi:hypothetical protein